MHANSTVEVRSPLGKLKNPVLSIVLIVRDPMDRPSGGLDALATQPGISAVEVVVVDGRLSPPDDISADVLERLSVILAPGENMPRLKALGAAATAGNFIAFLEPKAVPLAGWLEAALRTAREYPNASFGGTVGFASDATPANQAAFIFEYGAFSAPQLSSGRTRDLPGNNMVMPRRPFLAHCADILLAEGLNKPFCQQRLIDKGVRVIMVADMGVMMTTKHSLTTLLGSRFAYARCFGGTRVSLCSPARRLFYRFGAPAIPFMLLWRHFRAVKHAEIGRLHPATPAALAALCIVWAAGEATGYWLGTGASCEQLY